LMAKIAQLLKMDRVQLALFVEAVFSLALARFYVRFFAFKNYIYRVGKPQSLEELEDGEPVSENELKILRQVSQEISRAARNIPWDAVCLPQAMAGKWMLKRRNLSSTMFLGVAKEKAAVASDIRKLEQGEWQQGLKAHAWLKVGKFVVTGRQGHRQFTVVGRFK